MVKLKPSVLQLPVHLESLNTIVHNNNVPDAQTALDNNAAAAITQYCATNAEHEENLDILRENVPNKFTWNRGSKNGLFGETNRKFRSKLAG